MLFVRDPIAQGCWSTSNEICPTRVYAVREVRCHEGICAESFPAMGPTGISFEHHQSVVSITSEYLHVVTYTVLSYEM